MGEFLDREEELARLEGWWAGSERMPVNLYGRRRVGYAIDSNLQLLLFSRGGHNATIQKVAANNQSLRLLGIREIA
jgi:hypothetical protein